MACIMNFFFFFHFFRSRVITPYIYIFRVILFFLPKLLKKLEKKLSLFGIKLPTANSSVKK